MQFTTLSTFATLVMATLAAATPVPTDGSGPSNQCNTGTLQCCTSVQSASSLPANVLTGLLGVVLGPVTALVGLNCSPIDVIAIAGNSCSAQPACCTGNTFNGLVTLACTPINANL